MPVEVESKVENSLNITDLKIKSKQKLLNLVSILDVEIVHSVPGERYLNKSIDLLPEDKPTTKPSGNIKGEKHQMAATNRKC